MVGEAGGEAGAAEEQDLGWLVDAVAGEQAAQVLKPPELIKQWHGAN